MDNGLIHLLSLSFSGLSGRLGCGGCDWELNMVLCVRLIDVALAVWDGEAMLLCLLYVSVVALLVMEPWPYAD